jgi:hypothetical protein
MSDDRSAMAILPTWVDSIPPVKQRRAIVEAAREKAEQDAKRMQSVDLATAAMSFGSAANEGIRLSVLIAPGKSSIVCKPYLPFVDPLLQVVQSTAGSVAVGGVLSYLNVVLTHGGTVGGSDLAARRSFLEREIRWLQGCVQRSQRSRLLGYAALATGRTDLARALSDDRTLWRLSHALEARERSPFYALVSQFPESDLSYSELLFSARAFVLHIEKCQLEGIEAASQWLYRVVHGKRPEPKYANFIVERTGVRRETPQETASRTFGPQPDEAPVLSWATLRHTELHPLFGGRSIEVHSNGEIWALDVEPTRHARCYRSWLNRAELNRIDRLIRENNPFNICTLRREDTLLKTVAQIVFANDKGVVTCIDAPIEPNSNFNALAGWLVRTGVLLMQVSAPVDVGFWNGRMCPSVGGICDVMA